MLDDGYLLYYLSSKITEFEKQINRLHAKHIAWMYSPELICVDDVIDFQTSLALFI